MCYISSMWVDLLAAADIDVAMPAPDTVVIDGGAPLPLKILTRRLRGRDVERLAADCGLVVAQGIGPSVRTRLTDAGWWWIDEADKTASLRGREVSLDQSLTDAAPAPRASWPRGYAAFAIVRALLLTGAADQAALAERAACSQPLVSRTLRRLAHEGLVIGGRSSWQPTPALVTWWVNRYPGPGGTTVRLWSPEAPWVNAATLVREYEAQGIDVTVTGAVAADALAPWTDPARLTVYVDRTADPSETRFVESSDADAPIRLVLAADATVTMGREQVVAPDGTKVWVTDPLMTAWTIKDASERSADQQVQRLLQLLPISGG